MAFINLLAAQTPPQHHLGEQWTEVGQVSGRLLMVWCSSLSTLCDVKQCQTSGLGSLTTQTADKQVPGTEYGAVYEADKIWQWASIKTLCRGGCKTLHCREPERTSRSFFFFFLWKWPNFPGIVSFLKQDVFLCLGSRSSITGNAFRTLNMRDNLQRTQSSTQPHVMLQNCWLPHTPKLFINNICEGYKFRELNSWLLKTHTGFFLHRELRGDYCYQIWHRLQFSDRHLHGKHCFLARVNWTKKLFLQFLVLM